MLHSKECAKKYIGGHLMSDKEMPKRERLSPAKNVDMATVVKLENIMNNMSCNLRPEKSRKECSSCPDYSFCRRSKAERSFIQKRFLKRRNKIIHKKRERPALGMETAVIEQEEYLREEEDHIEMAEQLANNGWGWE